MEIPVYGAGDLGLSPESVGETGSKVKQLDYFVPDPGEGAEMLEGSADEIVEKLVELLKARGGIK
jgi:electron transfer flavoprotein beta subunit